MKKGLLLTTILCGLLLFSGCGNKEQKLTCTLSKEDTATGYKMNSNYEVTAKGNKVTQVKTTEVVESESDEILEYFKTYIEESYTKMDEAYGGYDFTATIENQKLTVDTTIDYTVLDLDKLVKADSTMKQFVDKNNNLTLDGIQDLYEALGATCKVK